MLPVIYDLPVKTDVRGRFNAALFSAAQVN